MPQPSGNTPAVSFSRTKQELLERISALLERYPSILSSTEQEVQTMLEAAIGSISSFFFQLYSFPFDILLYAFVQVLSKLGSNPSTKFPVDNPSRDLCISVCLTCRSLLEATSTSEEILPRIMTTVEVLAKSFPAVFQVF